MNGLASTASITSLNLVDTKLGSGEQGNSTIGCASFYSTYVYESVMSTLETTDTTCDCNNAPWMFVDRRDNVLTHLDITLRDDEGFTIDAVDHIIELEVVTQEDVP